MRFRQSLSLGFLLLHVMPAFAGVGDFFSQTLATAGGDLQEKIYGACLDEVRTKLDTQCLPVGAEKSLGEILNSQNEWQKVLDHLKKQDTQPLLDKFYREAKEEQREAISCEMSQLRSLLGVRTLPDGNHVPDEKLKTEGDIFIQGVMRDLCPKLPLMKKIYEETRSIQSDLETAMSALSTPSIYASHPMFLGGKSYSTSEGLITSQKRVLEVAQKISEEKRSQLSRKVAEFNAYMASIWKASNPKMEEYIRQQMEETNPSSCLGADPQKGTLVRDQFRNDVIGGVGGGIAGLNLNFGDSPGMIYQAGLDLSGVDMLNQRGRALLFERSDAGRLLQSKAAHGDPRAMVAACRIQKESDGVKTIEQGVSKATWLVGGFGFFLRAARLTALAANMSSEMLMASRVFLISATGLGVAESGMKIQNTCFSGSPTTIYNKPDRSCPEGAVNWVQETETLEKENCALSLVLGGLAVVGGYKEARALLKELGKKNLAGKIFTRSEVSGTSPKTTEKEIVVTAPEPSVKGRSFDKPTGAQMETRPPSTYVIRRGSAPQEFAPDRSTILKTDRTELFETKLANGKPQLRYTRLEINPATGQHVSITYDVPKNAATGTIDAKTEIGRAVLDDMIKEAQGKATLVFWDANHLGLVNYMKGGTSTGDKYLGLVADSIKSRLRDSDIVFSNGGDEFVGIIRSTDPNEIKLITQRTSDAVAEHPEIRKIFRQEVSDLSNSYKQVSNSTKFSELPKEIRESLSPTQIASAQKDFNAFKTEWLTNKMSAIKRQSMYKGSISLGSSPVQPGEDLSTVLQRAEATAAQMKANYKASYGFDTAKYGQSQTTQAIKRRGAPSIVTEKNPLPKPKAIKDPQDFIARKDPNPPFISNGETVLESSDSKLVEVNLPNGKTQLRYIRQEAHLETGEKVSVSYDVPRNAVSGAIDSKSEIGRSVLQDILKSQENKGSAVFIDLNHLGRVNYMKGGTVTGDQYISLESRIIRDNLRPGDLLFHNGGDEQIIILNTKDPQEIKKITQRISDSIFEDPQIREIFRNEVKALRQQYQEVSRMKSYQDLTPSVTEGLSLEQKNLARKDFTQFKKQWLDNKLAQMQEQSMYKGSISIGTSLVRSGDDIQDVLARAETAAAQMKSTYKAKLGFDASKYGVDQSETLLNKRARPIVLDPVP